MKKLFCVILAATFLLAAASCGTGSKETPAESAPTETTAADTLTTEAPPETTVPAEEPTSAQGLAAETANRYLRITDALSQRYGTGEISDNGYFLRGLAFVRLIDLDGDGAEELVCGYENPDRGEFFSYVNEYAVYGPDSDEPLFDPRPVSNFGNGDAPGIAFLTKDGQTYLEEYEGGIRIRYHHLESGSLITDISFEESEDYENGTVTAWLNGEECDEAAALAALEQFEEGGQKDRTEFFDYENAGTLAQVLRETDRTLNRLETLGGAGM
ncbi:MAG: hypothetical protein IJK89_07585 [Clostridia bacterium]|nr:hypothetical protein [Clostridia bacterium]